MYREAFTDLWEHVNALAVRKRLDTVNLGTEHSTHGDHEARVRSHGFIGPDLPSGVRFGWNPVLSEITTEDVVWRGIVPNINVTKPQKRSLRSDLPGCCYQALLRRRSQDTSHLVAKRLQPHRRQQVIVQFRVCMMVESSIFERHVSNISGVSVDQLMFASTMVPLLRDRRLTCLRNRVT